MSLAEALAGMRSFKPRPNPLWTGPNGEGPNGGVTQGLIARWLADRERCRLHTMEGLRPHDVWEPKTGFGNLWHVCEEALARHFGTAIGLCDQARPDIWETALLQYALKEMKKYPTQTDLIEHWCQVCRVQFPVYVEHWADHPDVTNRVPLLQEHAFDVRYKLSSGRSVRLRGKWDSVDLIDGAIYLQENKTKSQIVPEQIKRQLTWDLQTEVYLIALDHADVPIRDLNKTFPGYDPQTTKLTETQLDGLFKRVPVAGVRYNVIRRDCPIRRHQATAGAKCPKCKGVGGLCVKCGGIGRIGGKPQETRESYYGRLVNDYFRANTSEWFMRWRSEVHEADRTRFRKEFLDPVLEMMLDDYEWWHWVRRENGPGGSKDWNNFNYEQRAKEFPYHRLRHYRHPFGTYNVLNEGGGTDLDEYLNSGSEVGLTHTDVLFPELVS